jgi:hypothetical protein
MGPDVLQPKAAIKALEVLEADERVVLLHEPDGVDAKLKTLVATSATTPNLWTDGYLAAFARQGSPPANGELTKIVQQVFFVTLLRV